MPIIPFRGKTPRIHPTAFVAPNATLIGDVEIGPDAGIYYGAVLRGDLAPIVIGARSNVQDNCVLHVERDAPCILEEDVTLGHMAMVHGAYIESASLIGMQATVLSHSRIGTGSLIAAGSVVKEHAQIPAGSLVAGVPGSVKRQLGEQDREGFIAHAGRYVDLSAEHREALS
ncbi:MAG: gamma carbonic anhydrase family protein [Corynebacterium sp.]|nr:gamma carbonic anhydrase family protein [Corynebacterium sp.]